MDKIFEKNISLARYTTFKIGGPAKYFFIAKDKEGLINALKVAKEFKLPVFILGGGSNVLISDKGFKGLVIKIEIEGVKFNGPEISIGAGVNSTALAYNTAEQGLSGLEWMAGLPGTIGGAIFGNAHAFGFKTDDSIKSVQALDVSTLEFKNFTKEQCEFSLKNSVFKKNKNLIIISAVLKLEPGNSEEIKNKITGYLKYRREKHPINFPSAGSIFINPEKAQSWQLIHECGLTGKKIGGAQISEKHSNFFINLGSAKAKDVLKLINLVKKEVKKKFGINLETEIQFI